ncbi:MAG: caspase family protein [Bacteroidota bacterium]
MRSAIITLLVLLGTLFSVNAQECIKGNCQNGAGTMLYKSGAKYVGQFKNGRIQGQGILYFSNGNKYIGNWENQYRQGKGRLVYKNGDVYLGNFQQNRLQGFGKMEFARGGSYEGEWAAGEPHGKGIYHLASGDIYDGDFVKGLFEGYGKMTYANGGKYEGYWKKNKRHGKGVLVAADGKVTDDIWVNGKSTDEHYAYNESQNTDRNTSSNFAPEISTSTRNDVKIWAVVVGVGSYEHMPSLRFTDDDAYQLYAFLKSPEGGALPDNQIRVLIDENATHRNIRESIRRVLHKADENDVALFYFSGHGLESSFLPVDYDGVRNELLHDEIKELIDQSRAKHKIVIADACHSGGYLAYRSTNVDRSLEHYYKAFEQSKGGTALLLSSKEKEYSLEDGGLRSGVFSYFIIRGLKGEADKNGDRIINVQELFNFTRVNVRKYTASMQTPVLMGNFDGKMPLAVVRY